MSILTDTWRGLVQRRLWPLALLLLAALVAVPVLLSKEPPPPELPSPAANAAAEAAEISSSPIVAEASAADREQIRRVVGAKVDPFKPAPAAKVKKAAADKAAGAGVTVAKGAAVTTTTVGPASGGVPSAGGFGGGGSIPSPGVTTPSTPATPPTPAAPRKPTYPLYSLAVRWGATDSTELTASRLERLKALPSNDAPVVIYLGVLEDEETAVFMVDASATPDGDGRCRPAKADCQTLHLREGETAFFDVADAEGNVTAQYQLDLVDIAKGRTANAKKAAQARAAVAKGGKALLRKRLAQASSYDYDQRAGLLEKLPVETVKGKLAKIAGAIGF